MYLVDTDVISRVGPIASATHPELVDWMDRNSKILFISTITIAELQSGVMRLHRIGAQRRAKLLSDWLGTVLQLYTPRLLPLGLQAGLATGDLLDRADAAGHDPGFADLAIAGTAVAHRLIVLTRNLRHFLPLGIAVEDPIELISRV